jgi:hypothetical protein
MVTKHITDQYGAGVIECRGRLQTNQGNRGRAHLMANCAAITKASWVRGLGAGENQGRNLMTLSVSVREV